MAVGGRVTDLARRVTGRGIADGHFDGLGGRFFTGWTRSGEGRETVSLMFGDALIARANATMERADLARAGVVGGGFAVPVEGVEAALRRLAAEGAGPAVLKVTTPAGDLAAGRAEPIAPADLLSLIALSLAVQTLGAPIANLAA